jgi:dTDP-4-amino-4,6-dideoxygalactose transaminase
MTLRYHRFDPGPCAFPRPRVPVLPPPTSEQWTWRSLALPKNLRHYARGRYALKAAYALAGVGPGGALLAPAYHCRTMLDPALRLGAEVILYPLTPELHPDMAALRRLATESPVAVKALLFTHYFGLPRDIAPVSALCRELGIVLVEDCSHALTWGGDAGEIGRTGRYAVSSPYKFFPCPDGGLLWCNDGATLPPERPAAPGIAAELRGIATAWRRLREGPQVPDAGALGSELQTVAPRLCARAREWTGESEALSNDYVQRDESAASLAVSRWIMCHNDVEMLTRRRRQRYAQWVEAVAGVPGCRALFPALPAGSVPYMFPLRVDRPQDGFYPLKHLGLPIWRWDDMAVSDCVVSQQYRQGVFHLPCHQALTDAQMQWMASALRRVLTAQ